MNRLKIYLAQALLVICILAGSKCSHAQGAPGDLVKTAKTKGGTITYVIMPRSGYDMDLFSKEAGEPYDFAAVIQRCAGEKKQVVFAMNGARCDKNLKPLGLLIKGLNKHRNLLWPDANMFGAVGPSAVFAIDRNDVRYIIPTDRFKPKDDLASYRLAIQSGTILISKSFLNRNITRAVGKKVYNGIGLKANGEMVFAVTNDEMSLHDFALFFQDLNCKDAMVLDEGANCQWYAPGMPKKPGKIGEVIVVERK